MTTRKEALEVVEKALYPWRRSEVLKVIRALDAAGWQCVPKEATDEMLDCGDDEGCKYAGRLTYERFLARAPNLTEMEVESGVIHETGRIVDVALHPLYREILSMRRCVRAAEELARVAERIGIEGTFFSDSGIALDNALRAFRATQMFYAHDASPKLTEKES